MFSFFSKQWNPRADVPDLSGKVALVTGGNAGIGSGICSILAANNCKVYLGARSEARAKAAIEKIEIDFPEVAKKKNVVWLKLDLTEPRDVIAAAKEFMAQEERLDILVNNAARLPENAELTRYGIDLSIAVNHIGPFVLIDTLLPTLQATAALPNSDVRIVLMSSDLRVHHRLVPTLPSLATPSALATPWPTFAASDAFLARMQRYGYTKILNEYYKGELQRRLSSAAAAASAASSSPTSSRASIVVISTDPGMVRTQGSISTYPLPIKVVASLFGSDFVSGATSALFAATAGEVRGKGDGERYEGGYLDSYGRLVPVTGESRDERVGREVWESTKAVVERALG